MRLRYVKLKEFSLSPKTDLKNKYSKMVRPLGNRSKIKPLKGNATGLNLLGLRTILTDQTPSTVKTQSKRFIYALQPSWRDSRKDLDNCYSVDVLSSNEEKETEKAPKDSLKDTQCEDIFSFSDTDFVDPMKITLKKCSDDTSQTKQLQRKHRMRNELGNLIRRVRMTNPVRKSMSPKHPNRCVAQRLNSLTINIRRFKVGALTKTFLRSDSLTSQCTFTVDYIEIANAGRIEASDVVSCEWCTVQRLPALFLQTTHDTYLHLQVQLHMFEDDSRVLCDCQSRNEKEKYVVLIFENELTLLEQITLEEIFTEIGKHNNISCFPVKLSFEEASKRLKAHNCAQEQEQAVPLSPSSDVSRCEIATLSISDSDEDDLIELPSSTKQDIKKLIVYPPPPAKGGLTVTKEDLSCLEEGEFLNDVIVDFYLRFLVCEQQKKEDATKYHVFSSFFFKHLTQEDHKMMSGSTGLSIEECRHNRVKTWTRNVNLFEKEFIFVPINQRAHWYLAVICFPGEISQTSGLDLHLRERRHSMEYLYNQSPPNPMSLFYSPESSKQLSRWSQSIDDSDQKFCFLSDDEAEEDVQAVKNRSVLNGGSNFSKRPCILIMDSLTCRGRSSVVQTLQQYLQEEWKVKMGSEQSFGKMSGWSPIVPQQDNSTDCGIYLLQYVESFLKDPPQAFHHSMDLNGWFSQRRVKKKRGQIKQLILRLHRDQKV